MYGPEGRELSRGRGERLAIGTGGVATGVAEEKKFHFGKGLSFEERTGLGKIEKEKQQMSTRVGGMGRQSSGYPSMLAYQVRMETGLSKCI